MNATLCPLLRGACLSLIPLCSIALAQSTTNLAGTYSLAETMELRLSMLGSSQTQSFTNPTQEVMLSQAGNVLSYAIPDLIGGTVDRWTITLSGNTVSAMTGPAIAGGNSSPFWTELGFSFQQNQITSATGTAEPGRIQVSVQGRMTGSYLGISFTALTSSTMLFTNPSLQLTPPVITGHPRDLSLAEGATALLGATATGSGPLTYQWSKDGTPIPGATTASLTITAVRPQDSGRYSVVVSNAQGSVTSTTAVITVLYPPRLDADPKDLQVRSGSTAVLSASFSGTPPLQLQWTKDGRTIPGATTAFHVITPVSPQDTGIYYLLASNALGGTSARLTLNVLGQTGLSPARLSNLSVRTVLGAEDTSLIVGFVSGGSGTSGGKALLVRGIGPCLALFGVTGSMADPLVTMYSGETGIAANNDWGGDAEIARISAAVGAFALSPATSRDSALYRANQPVGAYSVHITGNGGTGAVLAEVYDATPAQEFAPTTPRLLNLSARASVGSGADILIAGFVVTGPTAQTVLIRGIGPTLALFGVNRTLINPHLAVYSGGAKVAENDDWSGSPHLVSAAAKVGAFRLDNATSRDAALLLTLPPGAYTAQVSGINNTSGVALVEVYEVP